MINIVILNQYLPNHLSPRIRRMAAQKQKNKKKHSVGPSLLKTLDPPLTLLLLLSDQMMFC